MVAIVLIGLALIISILRYYHRKHKKLIKYLNLTWGKETARDYDYNDLQNIKAYWEIKSKTDIREPSSAYIDDLTWNDLNMDEVFMKINNTESIIGESYLYDRLHCLSFDVEELNRFEKLIKEMEVNEKSRLAIQVILNKLGKGMCNRIPSYLFEVDEKVSFHKPIYNIIGALPVISLFSMLININVGFTLLLASIILSAYIHYTYANKLVGEMKTLNDIYSILKTAKKISKIENESLKPICNTLKESCLKLGNILSLEGLFFLSTNTDLGILQEYISAITLSNIRIHHKFLILLKKEADALRDAYDALGMLEASIAVASYRKSVGCWTTPKFVDSKTIEVGDIYHPLIKEPVPNSIKLDKNIIVTGSNASGKSTFIKSLAINGILSQSINTVLATKFIAPLSYYMTSMAISDNIITSESYYIAEIKSLKRVLDTINKYPFSMCFIDEILKGTNTIERIAASSAILKHLNSLNCRCLIASHDIEITQMLATHYDNYHFREAIDNSKISFDYKVYKGPSTTRNAIKLLEVMDYDPSIINNANRLASYFSDNQIWLNP